MLHLKSDIRSFQAIQFVEVQYFPKSENIQMWDSFLEWIFNTKLVLVVPEFSVFLLSTFILYVFFDIPYVNFPEYAVEIHNVTETKASYLVSSIGLTNMFSMLFCGIVADWSRTSQARFVFNLQ